MLFFGITANLETEVEIFSLDIGVLLRFFSCEVDGIALNMNGLDRADVLTAATAYA